MAEAARRNTATSEPLHQPQPRASPRHGAMCMVSAWPKDLAVWQVDVRMLQDLLRAFQPELARVLEDVEVPLDLICSQWLLSLFSMNLPLDTCVAC